jgi:hypothetical protein
MLAAYLAARVGLCIVFFGHPVAAASKIEKLFDVFYVKFFVDNLNSFYLILIKKTFCHFFYLSSDLVSVTTSWSQTNLSSYKKMSFAKVSAISTASLGRCLLDQVS